MRAGRSKGGEQRQENKKKKKTIIQTKVMGDTKPRHVKARNTQVKPNGGNSRAKSSNSKKRNEF
jgi:hypothetical protein